MSVIGFSDTLGMFSNYTESYIKQIFDFIFGIFLFLFKIQFIFKYFKYLRYVCIFSIYQFVTFAELVTYLLHSYRIFIDVLDYLPIILWYILAYIILELLVSYSPKRIVLYRTCALYPTGGKQNNNNDCIIYIYNIR